MAVDVWGKGRSRLPYPRWGMIIHPFHMEVTMTMLYDQVIPLVRQIVGTVIAVYIIKLLKI